MIEEYPTSMYITKLSTLKIPTRKDMKQAIWDNFEEIFYDNKKIELDNEYKKIIYKDEGQNVEIYYKVRDIPENSRYIITFFPYKSKRKQWTKEMCRNAVEKVLKFCDELGDTFKIEHEIGIFNYERIYFNISSSIDISDWNLIFYGGDVVEKLSIQELFEKDGYYGYILTKIPKNAKFYIFSNTYEDKERELRSILNFLQSFGEVCKISENKIIGPLNIAKDFAEKLHNRDKCVFIFIEKKERFDEPYKNLKIYYDTNNIPSQFINDNTIFEKLNYPGVRSNIILEIFTKIGLKPIDLRPPEDILDVNGFLCLSDLEITNKKLFGALFTYSREGTEEEEVQIYNDLKFEVTKDTIDLEDESINLLANKINLLIGRSINIDVIITKEWKYDKLKKLIDILKQNDIKINRVYYISMKTSRFVDKYLISGHNLNVHPYLILSNKVGFIRTSTNIRFYSDLSSIYIKLFWPKNEKLIVKDLNKILWLVKKRIYRIQEFYQLKIPEPVKIFRNINKMYIKDFESTLTIPYRLLI